MRVCFLNNLSAQPLLFLLLYLPCFRSMKKGPQMNMDLSELIAWPDLAQFGPTCASLPIAQVGPNCAPWKKLGLG